MRYFIALLLFLSSITVVESQNKDFSFAGDIGYSHKFNKGKLDQLHLGVVSSYSKGGKHSYVSESQVLFGAGIYYSKLGWIPDLTLGYGYSACVAKVSATTYNITPTINLNAFNVAQIGVGYSFGFKRKDNFNMNGMVLSVGIMLGKRDFYYNWD